MATEVNLLAAAGGTAPFCLLLLFLNALHPLLSNSDERVPAGSLGTIVAVQRVEASTLLAPSHTRSGGGGMVFGSQDEVGGNGVGGCVIGADPIPLVVVLLLTNIMSASQDLAGRILVLSSPPRLYSCHYSHFISFFVKTRRTAAVIGGVSACHDC